MKKFIFVLVFLLPVVAMAGRGTPVGLKSVDKMGRFMDETAVETVEAFLTGYITRMSENGCEKAYTYEEVQQKAEQAWVHIKYNNKGQDFHGAINQWMGKNIQCDE